MDLTKLTDDELHLSTIAAAENERVATLNVINHLREVERRYLFAKKGYRDLKQYCVQELKLSEGSAWRRISVMRLVYAVPEVAAKYENGDLDLTQISMAQAFFRQDKTADKEQVLKDLENQTVEATERILVDKGYVAPERSTGRKVKDGLQITLDPECLLNWKNLESLWAKKFHLLK